MLVTLTTDFGTRDGYVGAMKGVILSICPTARIVDISHDVPRQDILAGAMVLAQSCPYFPGKTIHLAVVDPGVGTQRKAMVAVNELGTFVLPDNGLIGLIDRDHPIVDAFEIENPDFCRSQISTTFHGRDIFAPTAAQLASGKPPALAGNPIKQPKGLPLPEPNTGKERIEGTVIYIDIYGNAITNVGASLLQRPGDWMLEVEGRQIPGPFQAYGEVGDHALLWLIGSSGHLEVSINGGNATTQLGLRVGSRIILSKLSP